MYNLLQESNGHLQLAEGNLPEEVLQPADRSKSTEHQHCTDLAAENEYDHSGWDADELQLEVPAETELGQETEETVEGRHVHTDWQKRNDAAQSSRREADISSPGRLQDAPQSAETSDRNRVLEETPAETATAPEEPQQSALRNHGHSASILEVAEIEMNSDRSPEANSHQVRSMSQI